MSKEFESVATDIARLAKVVRRVYVGIMIVFLFLILWVVVVVT